MNSFPVNFNIRHTWVWAWSFVWKGTGIFFSKYRHKLFVEDISFAGTVTLKNLMGILQKPLDQCFSHRPKTSWDSL